LAQKKLDRLNETISRGEYVAVIEFVIAYAGWTIKNKPLPGWQKP
jgi:hypothetical protein